MIQKFIKTGSATQRCSTMETGDHSKNGANPKSQMSRGNLLMLFMLGLVFFVFPNKLLANWPGSGTQSDPWFIAHSNGLDNQAGGTVRAYVSIDGKTLNIYLYGNGETNMADFWDTGGEQGGEAPWWWSSYKNTIENILIENGVTNIGKKAFEDLQNLKSIDIPSTVTKINARAFNNCKSLQSVTIPSTVNTVEGEAFRNSKITTLTIPNGTTLAFIGYKISSINYFDWFKGCIIQTLILDRNYSYEGSNPPFYYMGVVNSSRTQNWQLCF